MKFYTVYKIALSLIENEFKITRRDEFLSLLGKAYWLETQSENIMLPTKNL
jgi:hypothetical protein